MEKKKNLIKLLHSGIREANLSIPDPIQAKLLDYIEYLDKWNAVHNLTSVRDPLEMIHRHILDSLVVLPFLPQGRVLDLGTGAGLPGIPLALSQPDRQFVLLDSNQKKINFVQHMILSLELRNTLVVCSRAESYQPKDLFDLVISRAFGSLKEFVRFSKHLCKRDGRMIAMKGVVSTSEIEEISMDTVIEKIENLKVPGSEALRTLIFIKHKTEA